MTSNRDKLKALNEAKGTLPKKAKKEVGTQVRFRCGHKKPLISYASKLCPQCTAEERVKKNLAAKQKVRAEQAKKPWKHGIIKARLPVGSCFSNLLWTGQEWQGTLMVPDKHLPGNRGEGRPEREEFDYLTFTTTAAAVFKLLPKLDCMYRDHLENERRMRDGNETIEQGLVCSQAEDGGTDEQVPSERVDP